MNEEAIRDLVGQLTRAQITRVGTAMGRVADVILDEFGKYEPKGLTGPSWGPLHEALLARADLLDKLAEMNSELVALHGKEVVLVRDAEVRAGRLEVIIVRTGMGAYFAVDGVCFAERAVAFVSDGKYIVLNRC